MRLGLSTNRFVAAAVIAGGAVGLLAGPGSAAAAVRIGEPADQPDMGQFAGLYCVTGPSDTFATTEAPAGVQVSSPIDGVIVQWRLRDASGPPMTATLRVLRPGPGGQFTAAGTSAQTAPFTGLGVFPARLPIAAGDYIGVDLPCSSSAPHQQLTERFYAGGGAHVGEWTPSLVDGGALRAPSYNDVNYTAVMDADIEPDADHDGYGDETQDQCPTDATTQTPCPAVAPPAAPRPDTTAPNAGASFKRTYKLSRALRRGIGGGVKSNEGAHVKGVGSIPLSVAKKLGLAGVVRVASGRASIASPGKVSLTLKFTPKAKQELAAARRFKLTVRISVADAAGNTATLVRKVTLKR